ncbi:hypothetical protein HN937_28255 [Candidatus Poribacteria bacterium]|jgi:hypothetical protein|nr:hypothetical protein [Candidatus Poribacteria bacterium]
MSDKTTNDSPRIVADIETSDDGRCDHVFHGPKYKRYAVGTCKRGQEARQEFQGPMVPGPWAYGFGLGGCITAEPETGSAADDRRSDAAGKLHDIVSGDCVRLDGDLYRITLPRWGDDLILTPVAG